MLVKSRSSFSAQLRSSSSSLLYSWRSTKCLSKASRRWDFVRCANQHRHTSMWKCVWRGRQNDLFVIVLLPTIQTTVARIRESNNFNKLSCEVLAHYLREDGNFHRARLQCSTANANTNGGKNSKNVYCPVVNHPERPSCHYNTD